MKAKSSDIAITKIRAWLDNPDTTELTDHEKLIWSRWDFAYDQLKYLTPSTVINRLKTKFGVSYETAKDDIANVRRLLYPVNRHDVEWLERIIIEDAVSNMNAAREALNWDSWAKCRDQLIKIYALKQAQAADINPELLGNNNYFINVNFGEFAEKINMNTLHKLPEAKRIKLTDFIFPDTVTDEQIAEIMNS